MILAYSLLKQDIFFEKIPVEERVTYARQALNMGALMADEHMDKTVQEWFEFYKIKLIYKEKGPMVGGVHFRAQINYSTKKPSVTIFKEGIDELKDICPTIEVAVLAHELFHYLEIINNQHVNEQLPSIITNQIGQWKRKATIRTTSEIAAHKFAEIVGGFPLLTNYYDYLYLLQDNKITKANLQQYFDETANELTSLTAIL